MPIYIYIYMYKFAEILRRTRGVTRLVTPASVAEPGARRSGAAGAMVGVDARGHVLAS
jgi:hypothetical protein